MPFGGPIGTPKKSVDIFFGTRIIETMKKVERDGNLWFIAETDTERQSLTAISKALAASKINHQFIYDGPPGQENPVVEELSY